MPDQDSAGGCMNDKSSVCEVCGIGCGCEAWEDYLVSGEPLLAEGADEGRTARVMRLVRCALDAESARGTKRWLARVYLAGASENLPLRRCEALLETHCGRFFHRGCELSGVGQCVGCGAWLGTQPAGPGCPVCGAGATASGEAEKSPPTPEEVAEWEKRITGQPAKVPAPDRRLEAIEKMQRMLADAKESLDG